MFKRCWFCLRGNHQECWGMCSCLVCFAEDKDEFDWRQRAA